MPPPLAPPPDPDYAAISVGLSLAAVALLVLFCLCWCYAPARLAHLRVRKKALYAASEAEIEDMILRGQAAPAEDMDPELEVNPIQAFNLEQEAVAAKAAKVAKAKQAKKAEQLRKQTLFKRNPSTASGFIVAGAFAKLGINISFKASKHARGSSRLFPTAQLVDIDSVQVLTWRVREAEMRHQEARRRAGVQDVRMDPQALRFVMMAYGIEIRYQGGEPPLQLIYGLI